MALVDIQNLQKLKEMPEIKDLLLQRNNIRTMKKDLKRLREADTLKESEKIIKLRAPWPENQKTAKTIIQEPKKIAPTVPIDKKNPVIKPIEKAEQPYRINLDKIALEEQKTEKASFEREKASELEKQQIFLLESQRKDLESQIRLLNQKEMAFVKSEKDKILQEKAKWQEKLNQIKEEEAKQSLEEQKRETEKERWLIEQELTKMESRIEELGGRYEKFQSQENELKGKISEINNSLKQIYSAISKREAAGAVKEPEVLKEKIAQPAAKPIGLAQEPKEKEYLRGVPESVQEKLAEATEKEKEQRKKFMEEVEKWAAYYKTR